MPHVITHDKRVNLMANIRAAREALDARIRAGGNWKGAASAARELGHLLDQLAEWDEQDDAQQQPRTRVYTPQPRHRVGRRRYAVEEVTDHPALPEPGP